MYQGRKAQSPFDGFAGGRLRRMGLADANGNPDQDAIVVCNCIFAGQFFDDPLAEPIILYRFTFKELLHNLAIKKEIFR